MDSNMNDENANIQDLGHFDVRTTKAPKDWINNLVAYYDGNLTCLVKAAIGAVESFVDRMYAIRTLSGEMQVENDARFVSTDGTDFFQNCNWITLNTEGREKDWDAEGVKDDELKIALKALSFSLRKSIMYAQASAEIKTLPNAANSVLFCSFYFSLEDKMITFAEPIANQDFLPQSEVERMTRKIFVAFEAINKNFITSYYARAINDAKEKLLNKEKE